MKRFIALLFVLTLTASCGQQESKKEVVGANAGPAPTATGYIVQVGDAYITEKDLENELAGMPESRRLSYLQAGGEERLLDEVIKREMFRQEAIRAGLDQSEEYRQRVRYLSRLALVEMFLEDKIQSQVTVSDQEINDYYQENMESEFTNPMDNTVIPLATVRENIRRLLIMEKQRGIFDDFMTEMMERYVVEVAQEPTAPEGQPAAESTPGEQQ